MTPRSKGSRRLLTAGQSRGNRCGSASPFLGSLRFHLIYGRVFTQHTLSVFVTTCICSVGFVSVLSPPSHVQRGNSGASLLSPGRAPPPAATTAPVSPGISRGVPVPVRAACPCSAGTSAALPCGVTSVEDTSLGRGCQQPPWPRALSAGLTSRHLLAQAKRCRMSEKPHLCGAVSQGLLLTSCAGADSR